MVKESLEYLKTQRVGVLAVEMLDGSPHAATVHFAHAENPLVFYFETYREYRKAEPLLGRKTTRASFVVGSTEENMKTLQLDGNIELIQPEEKDFYDSVYLGKFPEKKEKSKDPKFVFFKFTPTWWRFTDWKTPEGKKIWCSTDPT
jgi:general stress protein 26